MPTDVQVGAAVQPVPHLLPISAGMSSPISTLQVVAPVMAMQTQPPPQVHQRPFLSATPATVSMVSTNITPINVGRAAAPMLMANPASYILAQCLGLPEPFDGTRAHWPDWVAKWKVWLASAFMGQQPEEGAMLIALLRCLPQSCVRELQRRFEDPNGRPVQFSEYWAWLEREYGGDGDTIALANLRCLELKFGGKLTLAAWREYCSDFRLQRSRVTDLTEDEARSLVVRRLPQFLTDRLAEEEAKRGQRHPWIRLCGLGGLREEQVRALVESQTLTRPHTVVASASNTEHKVECASENQAETLRALSGRQIASGGTLRVTTLRYKMTAEDILTWVTQKLRTKEEMDDERRLSLGLSGGRKDKDRDVDKEYDRHHYGRVVSADDDYAQHPVTMDEVQVAVTSTTPAATKEK